MNARFLDVLRDPDPRRAPRYRLTTDSLHAVGAANTDDLRATLRAVLDDNHLAKLAALDRITARRPVRDTHAS